MRYVVVMSHIQRRHRYVVRKHVRKVIVITVINEELDIFVVIMIFVFLMAFAILFILQ